jgi:transcriptional regulator with XRE-family HTH domain
MTWIMDDTFRVERQHYSCRSTCDVGDMDHGGESRAGERVRDARKKAGLTATELAQRSGRSSSGIRAIENGQNGLRPDVAEVLAPILKTTPEYLLTGRGAASVRMVEVVGYVGAGSEAHFYDVSQGGLAEVPAPENATDRTVAAEVRGESLGPFFDHWLVFYDDVRSPVTEDLIGHLCVVGLLNGKVLVKKLQAARTPGLFHLLSQTEAPMLDQEVLWAARVKSMSPR